MNSSQCVGPGAVVGARPLNWPAHDQRTRRNLARKLTGFTSGEETATARCRCGFISTTVSRSHLPGCGIIGETTPAATSFSLSRSSQRRQTRWFAAFTTESPSSGSVGRITHCKRASERFSRMHPAASRRSSTNRAITAFVTASKSSPNIINSGAERPGRRSSYVTARIVSRQVRLFEPSLST